MTSQGSAYWCYSCNRYVRGVRSRENVVCPDCRSGFIEQVQNPSPPSQSPRRWSYPTASPAHSTTASTIGPDHGSGMRRRSSGTGGGSALNPVIVLRGPPRESERIPADGPRFELYYDDGVGSELRPLPASMSEFLLGSGFGRLFGQFGQMEANGMSVHCHNSSAAKSAVEGLPTIQIYQSHVESESHCAVCTEAFELGSHAREMPCKHIYHSDCILPWLSLHNSCPVCRYQLPVDVPAVPTVESEPETAEGEDEETVGLTIWRIPGGGYAVGSLSSGHGSGEPHELPVVYTEMDGDFGTGVASSTGRVEWITSNRSRPRPRGGVSQSIRNFFSSLGRNRATSSPRSSSRPSPRLPHSGSDNSVSVPLPSQRQETTQRLRAGQHPEWVLCLEAGCEDDGGHSVRHQSTRVSKTPLMVEIIGRAVVYEIPSL